MKMGKNFIVSLAAVLVLAGCVNLKPLKTPEISTYVLDAAAAPPSAAPTSLTLLVTLPKAGTGLKDNRMAYVQQAHTLKYFSRNRWLDTPSNMLLPLMVQTLQDSKRFQAVVAAPYAGNADIRLDTDLLMLQQQFFTVPSIVEFVVRARLVNLHNQRILATKVFTLKQAAPADNPYGGVLAANKAVSQFLLHLSQFCVKHTNEK